MFPNALSQIPISNPSIARAITTSNRQPKRLRFLGGGTIRLAVIPADHDRVNDPVNSQDRAEANTDDALNGDGRPASPQTLLRSHYAGHCFLLSPRSY